MKGLPKRATAGGALAANPFGTPDSAKSTTVCFIVNISVSNSSADYRLESHRHSEDLALVRRLLLLSPVPLHQLEQQNQR